METLQAALSIALVFGMLGGALWWLRRRGLAVVTGLPARRKGARLEPLERLALSPTHALHLVRVGERTLLIATSPAGCQAVETIHETMAKEFE